MEELLKNRIKLELPKPESMEHAKKQCELVNILLCKLGASSRFGFNPGTGRYTIKSGVEGVETDLQDNGHWFNLAFFARG